MNACLKSSNLWCYVKKRQLTTNMRVALLNDTSDEDLSEQLLTIGNGRVPIEASSVLKVCDFNLEHLCFAMVNYMWHVHG